MKTRTAGFILRNRTTLLVIVLIISIFMVFQARKVEMSYNYSLLLPEKDSASIDYNHFKQTFGSEGNVMFFAIQDSNFYQLEKINDWIAMGDSLLTLDGIEAIVSVTHTFNIKKNSKEKKFEILPIFPKQIISQTQLDSLVKIVEKLPFYEHYLFNSEKKTYLMLLTIRKEILENQVREPFVKKIIDITKAFSEKYNLKLHYSGLPYIRVTTALILKNEMMLFFFLSLLVTIVILFLFFRSIRITFFCMVVVILAVIWAIGFMSLFGYKITQLTALLPPLLVVIGIPNCIFLINKYHHEYIIHRNKIKALQRIIYKIGSAIFLTNLTTASGFITLVFTSSRILQEFGIIAALNIMVLFLLSMLLIPTIFSFLKVPKVRHTKHLDNRLIHRIITFLQTLVQNRRRLIYIATSCIILFSIIGISKIKITGFIVDDLPQDNQILKDLRFFENTFDGLMPLEIIVDTKKPKGILKLPTLRKIDELDKKISSFKEVSHSVSIVNVIKFANQAYFNGKVSYYKLPDNQTKNFILSYAAKSQDKVNVDKLRSFVDSTQQKARINFHIQDIGTQKMEDLEKRIDAAIRSVFPEKKYNITVTGSSVIYYKGTKYLIQNLFVSLAIAVFLIAIFMAWMFSSIKMVFIALIPNVIPLILTASLMGFFSIPIKASTILIFAISFGISVDYTIHYLAKYRQELEIYNWNIKKSVINTLKEAGQSMIYTSVVLFFGFGIFTFSQFGGTVSLGSLVSFTLLASVFSNLVLLPTFLLSLEKSILSKTFKEPFIQIFEEDKNTEEQQPNN